MTATRGIGIVVLVAVVGLTIAPLAIAGFSAPLSESAGTAIIDQSGESGEQPSANEADRTGAADNGTSSETDLSTFIQSSAAETEAAVDIGLFNASYNSADTELRKSILSHRTDAIEDRTAELEAEKERLQANEDEMSAVAYDARMTRLTVQISTLEKSIDTVEQRVVDTGLNVTGLEELRSNAADLGGPNVSAVAEGLTGVELSETLSGGIRDRVNESTPDMPEIDAENVTDQPELSAGNLSNSTLIDGTLDETAVLNGTVNGTSTVDGAVNETRITDGTLDGTNVTDGALNETDVIDGTLNATDVTDETVNATNGSRLIDGATNGTSVPDPTVDENSTEGDTADENATGNEDGLDGLISGDLEAETTSTR